jgi:DnaJ family protein C protein 8
MEQGEITDNSVNTNTNSGVEKNELTQEEKEKLAEEEMKKLISELKSENFMKSTTQIKRLLNTNFINPYEILLLTPDATEDELKRQYRQLSLLVHPDKCQEENAADAFHGIYF